MFWVILHFFCLFTLQNVKKLGVTQDICTCQQYLTTIWHFRSIAVFSLSLFVHLFYHWSNKRITRRKKMLHARIQSDQLEQKIQSYSLSLILSLHTELQFFTPPHKSIGLHESNPAELHSKNNLVAPPSGHISPYQFVYKRVRCGETNLNSFTYAQYVQTFHKRSGIHRLLYVYSTSV